MSLRRSFPPRPGACAAAALAAVALTTGCLTPDQIVKLQQDVTDIRTEMQALQKQNLEATSRMDEVRNSIEARQDEQRAESAESKRQIAGVREDLRTVATRLDELQQRLAGFSQTPPSSLSRPASSSAVPATPSPLDTAPSAPSDPGRATATPDEIFNQAYADYSKGNYASAQLGFAEFLKRYPASERADDALYWTGLCHYDQGEYEKSIGAFDRLIQERPTADKVPGAHLKKALALLGMNRTAQGVVQLQYLVEHFPRSEEARIAADRLLEIGAKP